MNATLSLLLLLLKSLMLALGASRSHALDPRCPAITIISGDEEWANIGTLPHVGMYSELNMYVHPEPGFKGVSLLAAGDGWRYDGWFRLDNACFPREAEWWRLEAGVGRLPHTNNILAFQVKIGECSLWCNKDGHFPGDLNLNVKAQGPSRWRLEDPKPCSVKGIQSKWPTNVRCPNLRVHKTTTTTTTTSNILTATTITPTTTTSKILTATTITPTNTTSNTITTTTITPTTTTTTPTTTTITTEVVTVVVVLVVVNIVAVAVMLVAKRCIRQRKTRVPLRSGLEASWAVGGEVEADDNHVELPRVAAVLPRVPPRQEELDYLYMDGEKEEEEEHIYEEITAPALCRQYDVDHDDGAYLTPRRATPVTSSVVTEDEEPIYEEINAPAPCRQYEDVDHDDGGYLTPRRAPPGTFSGATEDKNMNEEIAAPAPCRQYDDVDHDDGAYLAPRRAPQGTFSWATEDKNMNEEIAAPAPCRQYDDVDHDDGGYLTPRRAPQGTFSGGTEDKSMNDEIAAPAPCRQYDDVDHDDGAYLTPRRAPPGTPSGVTEDVKHIYDEF